MEFKQQQLENGLQIIGEINPSAKSAAVGFFVKTGSRDETPAISGVSHFLEHMLFKGTDTLSALEVNAAFDDRGAQFNAFTSEENTVYYASVLPEYLEKVSQLWCQLLRPALRDSDFDMEKNVIKEEIAMYKDMPNFDVMDCCRQLHFDGHPCGNSVLGTNESIDALSSQQMRDYFGQRYAPNNITLAFAGNFQWDRAVALAKQYCSTWTPYAVDRQISHVSGSGSQDRTTQVERVCEHICLMSDGVAYQDDAYYAALLLSSIIGDQVGSRFFWELVDKALAEAAHLSLDGMDGTGALVSYIRCRPDKVAEVLAIVQSILADVTQQGITEDELRQARNKILSALVIKNELPMGRLVDLGFNWTYLRQYRTLEQDVTDIKAVTVDDVNAIAKQLKPDRYSQYRIGPAQTGTIG